MVTSLASKVASGNIATSGLHLRSLLGASVLHHNPTAITIANDAARPRRVFRALENAMTIEISIKRMRPVAIEREDGPSNQMARTLHPTPSATQREVSPRTSARTILMSLTIP